MKLPNMFCLVILYSMQCLVMVRATNYPSLPMLSNMIYSQLTTPIPSKYYQPSPIQYQTQFNSKSLPSIDHGKSFDKKPMKIMLAKTLRHSVRYQAQPPNNNYTMPMNAIYVETAPQTPVNIMFRSSSSNVNILQDHKQSKNEIRYMHSQEEPQILVTTLTKPIIQNVRNYNYTNVFVAFKLF